MIIGHQKQWEFLRKSAETGKISHAYLFVGQDQLGKRTMALKWISFLFGRTPSQNNGGGKGSQQPDLILIEPEKKEIKIGQIRDLIWKFSLKPYSAPLKIVLIDQAHVMNQEAQTCLLKTLEEPKGKALLILITAFPEYLLPTILSRVQTLKFYPVSKKEIKDYFKKQGISEGEIENITEFSLGRPGKALDFISDSKKLESFHQKVKELNRISDSTIAFRFQYAKNLSEDPQNLKTTLDIWLSYFRNILLLKINKGKSATQHSISELKNILKLIQTTKFLISTTNVNPRLALERLMLEF